MRAGSGILLVVLGLFVIYLGATGKLTNLGKAFDVLTGKQPETVASTGGVPAPNMGFPALPGVLSSLSTFLSAGNAAEAAGLPGGADAAATVFTAMA